MADLRLGKPAVRIDLMAHTPGVPEGNGKGNYESMPGHLPDGRSTAQRSTGVNPEGEEPIDKRMPNLSPP
ncbi:MAG: hypothetical protein QOJ12_1062 [Thermoleophilales bacterium]|nr:hypothetical protein [Thermoleophilales bacterium]